MFVTEEYTYFCFKQKMTFLTYHHLEDLKSTSLTEVAFVIIVKKGSATIRS